MPRNASSPRWPGEARSLATLPATTALRYAAVPAPTIAAIRASAPSSTTSAAA
jgi:hypothetical protein